MIIFVAAMDRNRGIGSNGKLPWHLPGDLQFFKKTTMGHAILMGRITYQAIGRSLPGRENIVLTANRFFSAEGVTVIHTLEEAAALGKSRDLYVIGGAQVFRQLLPIADKLILTQIHHEFPADTYFPELVEEEWRQVSCLPGPTDEQNPYSFDFVELVRQSRNG